MSPAENPLSVFLLSSLSCCMSIIAAWLLVVDILQHAATNLSNERRDAALGLRHRWVPTGRYSGTGRRVPGGGRGASRGYRYRRSKSASVVGGDGEEFLGSRTVALIDLAVDTRGN